MTYKLTDEQRKRIKKLAKDHFSYLGFERSGEQSLLTIFNELTPDIFEEGRKLGHEERAATFGKHQAGLDAAMEEGRLKGLEEAENKLEAENYTVSAGIIRALKEKT